MTLFEHEELRMHTPNPGSNPRPDEKDDPVCQPPVPPDQQDDVVPVQEPPKPGGRETPMIACVV